MDPKWTSGGQKLASRFETIFPMRFSGVRKCKRQILTHFIHTSRPTLHDAFKTYAHRHPQQKITDAILSKHATRVNYALGRDDARSPDGVAERRFPKAVTDFVDYSFASLVVPTVPRRGVVLRSMRNGFDTMALPGPGCRNLQSTGCFPARPHPARCFY